MADQRTPDWLLERIALEELPETELQQARQRLVDEPDGEARLAALAESNQEILDAYPPRQMAASIEARGQDGVEAPRSGLSWGSWLQVGFAAPALAAAVVFTLWVVPGDFSADRIGSGGSGGSGVEATRTKGLAPQLLIHRRAGIDTTRLQDDASAQSGEVLQLSYQAAGRLFGAVVSIDGRGAVTLHLPAEGAEPARLKAGLVALPYAYELDDAPNFERFVFVTSSAPVDPSRVMAAARSLAEETAKARSEPLRLPNEWEQTSVVLVKHAE